MDGYTICRDHRGDYERIAQHAGTHDRLLSLLEDCVPAGSTLVGIVLSSGSQIQPRRPLHLVG